MSRHLLQRFVAWTAFAVALLFPLAASAAILPMCEVDSATVMPRAPVAVAPLLAIGADEPTPSCDQLSRLNGADDDDVVDPKIAAFCDARGASAIAPQRIVPINNDARIDAAPACARVDISTPTVAASSHDGLATGSAAVLLDPAALDPSAMIHPASSELLPAYAPVLDVECSGVERSVYHPPR
jgi:hypothetical protein